MLFTHDVKIMQASLSTKTIFKMWTAIILYLVHQWGRNVAHEPLVPLFKVRVRPHQNACLKCPVVDAENSVLDWVRASTNTYLFRDNARTYSYWNLTFILNTCAEGTMEVINVTTGINDGKYTCWKSGMLSAYFEVKIEE